MIHIRYEPVSDYSGLYEFIGDVKIDRFVRSALISVGAEELFTVIKKQVDYLVQDQERIEKYENDTRELDKKQPKYRIEIYKIEKDYVPVKLNELLSNHFEKTMFLPENRQLLGAEKRFAYKAIELSSDKVIENTIYDKIESLKFSKWQRRNPSVIDPEVLRRLELDNDDPDFISWDDYVANDDEFEEGDDEYSPGF